RHRNVVRHKIRPPMHHATRTSAIRPCSHAPAASRLASESGRNTERLPWAIHLSGNREPTWISGSGRALTGRKYTPEANISTSRPRFDSADALRAVRARLETAIPMRAQAVTPSTKIQPSVSHLL